MDCELCGSKPATVKAFIEGSRLNVCNSCASHGGVIEDLYRPPAKRSIAYRREETIIELVDDFPDLVRNARQKRGLKQDELARIIKEPVSLIAKIESGKINPSEKTCQKLERELKIILLQELQPMIVDRPNVVEKPTSLGDIVKIKKRKSK